MRRWAPRARAYQLRYLARRAVRQGEPGVALRLCAQALASDPAIAWHEPARTFSTIAAAITRACLPNALYQAIEHTAMRVVGGLGPRLPA